MELRLLQRKKLLVLFALKLLFVSCGLETNLRQLEKEIEDIDPDCCYVEKSVNFPINKTNQRVGKTRLAVIIDDSFSMVQEMNWVREALINLAPLIKDSGADLDIEFYKISEIDENYFIEDLNNSGLKKFTFDVPDPVGVIEINESTLIGDIQANIQRVSEQIKPKEGFGIERGLCYITRFVNKLVNSPSNDEKLISVIITDEDEQDGNSSSNCKKEAEGSNLDDLVKTIPFVDESGSEHFRSAIVDYLKGADVDKNKNYVFVGVVYNENDNGCGFQADGEHGENYLKLAEDMTREGLEAEIGDVCSKSYTKMFEEKIVQKYIIKVNLEYEIDRFASPPIITGVVIKNDIGDIIKLKRHQYEVVVDKNLYKIKFSEDLVELLRENKEIEVFYNKKTD